MAEDGPEIALAPRIHHPRSDEETAIRKPENTRQQTSNKCFVYFLAAVVLQSIAFLIFGMVVLRFRSPQLQIEQVDIKNLQYATAPSPSLNMTVLAQVAIRNTNFGRFKFQNSSLSLQYGSGTFGRANIKGRRVKARKTDRMKVAVGVRMNGVGQNYLNFSSDINSRVLDMSGYAEVRGEIRVVKIFTRHRTAVMNCRMSLNLTSQSIQNLSGFHQTVVSSLTLMGQSSQIVSDVLGLGVVVRDQFRKFYCCCIQENQGIGQLRCTAPEALASREATSFAAQLQLLDYTLQVDALPVVSCLKNNKGERSFIHPIVADFDSYLYRYAPTEVSHRLAKAWVILDTKMYIPAKYESIKAISPANNNCTYKPINDVFFASLAESRDYIHITIMSDVKQVRPLAQATCRRSHIDQDGAFNWELNPHPYRKYVKCCRCLLAVMLILVVVVLVLIFTLSSSKNPVLRLHSLRIEGLNGVNWTSVTADTKLCLLMSQPKTLTSYVLDLVTFPQEYTATEMSSEKLRHCRPSPRLDAALYPQEIEWEGNQFDNCEKQCLFEDNLLNQREFDYIDCDHQAIT